MQLLWIISLSLLLVYLLRIVSYLSGWYRIGKNPAKPAENTGVSIVIALRDEEANIGHLIKDLVGQDYPGDRLEIILIDDNSSDKTPEIVNHYLGSDDRLRYMKLESSEQGKKAALLKGISAATHPVILSTDGDCRVKKNWVSGMVAGFSDTAVKMIIGTVIFEPDRGIFQAMQSLEFFSLTAVSAGSAGLNNPILCNAANLAYYRDDFLHFIEEREERSASGDDIFLMLWLKKRYPGSIRFLSTHGSSVSTPPAANLSSFSMQRMRWSSKSRFYRDWHMVTTALLVYGLNALLLALLIAFFLEFLKKGSWNEELPLLFGSLFVGKALIDLIILQPVLRHYKKTKLLWFFIPLGIIYFMYVSLIGLFGQFFSFSWKGRRVPVSKQN
ncbi:glycosyltransferase [Bacteroidota bacterium]